MRFHWTVIVCATLAGCASSGSSYLDDYNGIPWQDFKLANDDIYRLRDKPAERRMMIAHHAPGERAMAWTFGTGPLDPPKPVMEKAALQFLAESGRPGCRAVDAYLLASPLWEVKYDCAPPPRAAAAGR